MIEFKALKPEDIEVRVGQCSEKGVQLLLYKTARCDMKMLDEAVGQENWDCHYTSINGKLFCTVGIMVDKEPFGAWVYKQDVGVESNMEPAKGEASDAFKRACFKWGIGRELYTAPFIWVPKDKLKSHRKNEKSGKWACYDHFDVKDIKVDDGRIADLSIEGSGGTIVYRMHPQTRNEGKPPKDTTKAKTPPPDAPGSLIARLQAAKGECLAHGVSEEGVSSWYKARFGDKPINRLTSGELREAVNHYESLARDAGEVLDG